MERVIHAVDERGAGDKWRAIFDRTWPAYERWFLKQGDRARPTYVASLRALRNHMPELVPTYERLVDLAGGGDRVARFLSLYQPTPYLMACSQAVWTRDANPLLVRNYDYHPSLWEGTLLHSAWNGTRVIAVSDCIWGVLDGLSERGLGVSLAFGGRKTVGDGFGIPLVLRYVLEFCETTNEAVRALERIPSHMSYNITIVDRTGVVRTVHVAPDRRAVVTHRKVATNHQQWIEWTEYAHATGSVEREDRLERELRQRKQTAAGFVQQFLEPPIYASSFDRGWGTLYTASYDPVRGTSDYLWPQQTLSQSFASFVEQIVTIRYISSESGTGDSTSASAAG